MSTSPSWFDQEKFSRLVKKVAKPAPAAEPAPAATDAPAPDPAALSKPAAVNPPAPEPALPHVPASARSMMTSQSVSLKITPPPSVTPQPEGGLFDTDPEPAPTSHISLASKPQSPPTEPRSLPALPRRTAPLPALKSLFQYEIPASRPPAFPDAPPIQTSRVAPTAPPVPPAEESSLVDDETEENKGKTTPVSVAISAESLGTVPASGQSTNKVDDDLPAAWEKITQLNAELNQAIRERDQAVKEGALLREQLSQADETLKNVEEGGDFSQLTKDRDDARAESNTLREQLRQAQDSLQNQGGPGASSAELAQVTEERDESRREYAGLRSLFETWKQEQVQGKGESTGGNPELQQQLDDHRRQVEEQRGQLEDQRRQIDDHRQQLEDRDRQFQEQRQQIEDKDRQVKDHQQQLEDKDKQLQEHRQQIEDRDKQLENKNLEVLAAKASSASVEDSSEAHQQEVKTLQDQLEQTKNEASVAHRGLALSQKALQEMRDALRDATEASARSKSDMENLKNECSTLVQQNMFLQAQHDQVQRDLSAAKAKLQSKG